MKTHLLFGTAILFLAFTFFTTSTPPAPPSGNQVLQFDGVDDWADVNSPLSGNSDYTIEAWFLADEMKTCGGGRYSRIIGWNNFQMELAVCGGQLRFYNGKQWISSGIKLLTGKWYHVAVVRKSANYAIYINGNLAKSFSRSHSLNLSGAFSIGAKRHSGIGEYWKGRIDEVRIWKEARRMEEVKEYMEEPLSGTEPGLVGYWHFNDVKNGNVAKDFSPNSNDATLRNMDLSLSRVEDDRILSYNLMSVLPDTICNTTEIELQYPPMPAGVTAAFEFEMLDQDMKPLYRSRINIITPYLSKDPISFSFQDAPMPGDGTRKWVCGRHYRLSFKVSKDKEVKRYSKNVFVACCDSFDFDPVSCENGLVDNGGFETSNPSAGLPFGSWSVAYGTPKLHPNYTGYGEAGIVELRGGKDQGSALGHTLAAPAIEQSKKYRLSLAARLGHTSPVNYYRLRVYAYNGALSATDDHPLPSADIALVGQTGPLSNPDWVELGFPIWEANKDFAHFAIAIFNEEDGQISICEIDNVCLQESLNDPPCKDIPYDQDGNPIISGELHGYTTGFATEYDRESETFLGAAHDLYGHIGDTDTDDWFANWNDPCANFGGYIPPEASNWDGSEELSELGMDIDIDDIRDLLNDANPDPSVGMVDVGPIDDFTNVETEQCPRYDPKLGIPFAGRDIIFVHGNKLQHLCEKLNGTPGADALWPDDPFHFYDDSGYFKSMANETWKDHIENMLGSVSQPSNRYLVVTYNSAQRMEAGVHSVLHQIREAMANETGVVAKDGQDTKCFGKEAVIISHSTGGPLVDIALSIADKTRNSLLLQGYYGKIYGIPDFVKLHVSLAGAFVGSDFAAAVIGAGSSGSVLLPMVTNNIVQKQACESTSGIMLYPDVYSSIMVDLVPSIMTGQWGGWIKTTPVPVLLMPGGHPTAPNAIKHVLHPGFDDGVLTTACECAQPLPVVFSPLTIPRVIDMGIHKERRFHYFLDQFVQFQGLFPGHANGTCSPFLSPTGMFQMVKAVAIPPVRYNNHYPFLVCASDHFTGPRGVDQNNVAKNGVGFTGNREYDNEKSPENREETRMILGHQLYNLNLVDDSYRSLPEVTEKKKEIGVSIKIPKIIFRVTRWWFPRFRVEIGWKIKTFSIVIWRRLYFRLKGWETKNELDYLYEYVLTD